MLVLVETGRLRTGRIALLPSVAVKRLYFQPRHHARAHWDRYIVWLCVGRRMVANFAENCRGVRETVGSWQEMRLTILNN